tara:strand:+ start:253 stop:1329 length:1077 start_codon:yes stop_codon:yes gene_type:complete
MREIPRGGLDLEHVLSPPPSSKRKAPASPSADGNDPKRACWVDEPGVTLCPLTKSLMVDPVCAEDGVTYESDMIKKWIAENSPPGRDPPAARSPVNNQLISTLNPCLAVRTATEMLVLSGRIPENEADEYREGKRQWYLKRKDYEEAARWGLPIAQYIMSRKKEAEKDYESALSWATNALVGFKARERGKDGTKLYVQLARLLLMYGPSKDVLDACITLLEAAGKYSSEKCKKDRMNALGMLAACKYMQGDYSMAKELCLRCDTNMRSLTIGALYFHGLGGLQKDHEKALRCFKLAYAYEKCDHSGEASFFYLAAQAKHAWMLISGKGCDVDVKQGAELMEDCRRRGGALFVDRFNGV